MTAFREEVIGDARLILGDCREVDLPREDAAIVSDPPYGIAFQHDGGGKGLHKKRITKAIAGDAVAFDPAHLLAWPCVLFGGNHFYSRLPAGGTFHVWDKHCGRGTDDTFSDAEFFWTSWRRKSEVFRHLWKGILRDGLERDEPKYHVSQKPIALMRFCVGLVKAQTIIDPYMGSGSTGIAALQLGRKFVGVEIDPDYFAAACKRIETAQKQPALFAEPPPKPEQYEVRYLPFGEDAGADEAVQPLGGHHGTHARLAVKL